MSLQCRMRRLGAARARDRVFLGSACCFSARAVYAKTDTCHSGAARTRAYGVDVASTSYECASANNLSTHARSALLRKLVAHGLFLNASEQHGWDIHALCRG